jgi:phosphatidylserine/phosphatidylglycerophosphate/cardiolipin synthase-like enzyme
VARPLLFRPFVRTSLLLSLFLVALGGVGCVTDADGEADSLEQDATANPPCGSALGAQIGQAALGGASTIDGRLATFYNRVTAGPLVDAEDITAEMVRLVKSAKREVVLSFYRIEKGSWMTDQLRAAVRDVDHANVSVWIMSTPDKTPLTNLPGALSRGETAEENYRELRELFPWENVHVASWDTPDRLTLHVNHAKYVVVDGARAMMTDTNIQANADPIRSGGLGWFQLGVVVEGTAASAIRRDAADAWREQAHPAQVLPDAPPQRVVPECTRTVVLGRNAGDGEDASANRGYRALFLGAKKRINVITPNMNDDSVIDTLAAATKDADVYILLSMKFNDVMSRLPGQGGNNEHNVWRLAEKSNRKNLHIRWFARKTGVAVDGNVDGANHSKFASADGQVMILGSQNLDTQSWKKSRELGFAIDSAEVTKKFDAVFEDAWKRGVPAYEDGMKEPPGIPGMILSWLRPF